VFIKEASLVIIFAYIRKLRAEKINREQKKIYREKDKACQNYPNAAGSCSGLVDILCYDI